MIYYLENNGKLDIEGQKPIDFHPGTLICVPPHVIHGSTAKRGCFVNISVIDPHFPAKELGIKKLTVIEDNAERELRHLFSILYRRQTTADGHENSEMQKRNLAACIYDYVSNYIRQPENTSNAAELVKNALQEHYAEPGYTAADALKASGYSQNYIRQQFLTQYGITPQDHLTRLRMEAAASLLESHTIKPPIAEIASRCGYQDPLYFSKVFRKYHGTPPIKYKVTP